MIVNFQIINLNNKISLYPKKHKNCCLNTVSFGLNERNQQAINSLHENTGDRIAVINSFDMNDPDIEPCLMEFSNIVCEHPSNSQEMNVILDKLDSVSDTNAIKECLSYFTRFWTKLFLSTRTKASVLMDRLKIDHPPVGYLSRTATNPLYKDVALRNINNAQSYIIENIRTGECPDKNFIITIHKIITKDIPFITQDGVQYDCDDYSGIIEGSENDSILLHCGDDDSEKRLDNFMSWLSRNYHKDDIFQLAAQSYKKLLGISPFYDANGRTIRCFIDALLYSKGYCFNNYPANYAEIRKMKIEDIRNIFEENCIKIDD